MNKKIFVLLVFGIMFLSLVSAGDYAISPEGVKYDKEILDLYEDLIFIDLIVYLNNSSDFDAIIMSFSKEERGRIVNRNISNRFSIELTEKAFERLIKDERVESVYYNAPVDYASTKVNFEKNNLILIIIPLILIIILMILILTLKTRKKKNEKK